MEKIGSTQKDCGCHNHQGPHWLYRDYEVLKSNLPLLEQAIQCAQVDSTFHSTMAQEFTQQEQKRLLERQRHAGEYPYPYALLGPSYEDLESHRKHILQEYEQAVGDMEGRKRQRNKEGEEQHVNHA